MPDPCPGCQPTKDTQSYQRRLSKEEKRCERANQKALAKYEDQLAKFERARQKKLKQLEKVYISRLEDELVGTGDFAGNPSLMGAPPGDSGDPFDPCCCSDVATPFKSNDPILDRREDTSNIISIFVKPEQLGLDVSRKKWYTGSWLSPDGYMILLPDYTDKRRRGYDFFSCANEVAGAFNECGTNACSLRKKLMSVCYRYLCYFLTVVAILLTFGTLAMIYIDPIKGLF